MNLITGGSGFLGTALAERLIAAGKRVRMLDMRPPKIEGTDLVDFALGDVTNLEAVYEACKDVDIVFNLVSLLPCSRAGRMFWNVNVGGTKNVLKASMKRGVTKIVHVSSSIVYGIPERVPLHENSRTAPVGDYGKSKLAAENICAKYLKEGVDITVLRPRFIIGPGRLGLLTILFDWVRRGKKIYLIGSGENHFQMVSVYDLVEACILAVTKGSHETINIGADNVPTVREQMEALAEHAKTDARVFPIDATLARTVLRMLDFFKLTPLGTEHYLIADKNYILDTTKAKQILGWRPKYDNISMTIAAYDWYLQNCKDISVNLPSDLPNQGILKLLRYFS